MMTFKNVNLWFVATIIMSIIVLGAKRHKQGIVTDIIEGSDPKYVDLEMKDLKIKAKKQKKANTPNIIEKVKDLPPIVENYQEITDWETEWNNRIIRHRKVCEHFPEEKSIFEEWLENGPPEEHSTRSMIDTNHKVIYCVLPKCGGTNWKLTMIKMMNISDDTSATDASWTYEKKNDYGKKKRSLVHMDFDAAIEKAIAEGVDVDKISSGDDSGVRKYYLEEGYSIRDRVQAYTNGTYFKLIFVRNPLERILSAYEDKGRDLKLKERMYKAGKKEEYNKLDLEGFYEFLKYLSLRGITWEGGDTVRHWKRYYDLCRTCSIDWDFIGKVESIYDDSEHVMMRAGVKDKLHYGVHTKSTNYDKIIRYYKGIPKSLVLRIYEIFEVDFLAFGYTIPDWLWVHLADK